MPAYTLTVTATSFSDLRDGVAEIHRRFHDPDEGEAASPVAGYSPPSTPRAGPGRRRRGLLDDVSAAQDPASAGDLSAAEHAADGGPAGDLGSPAAGGTGALGAGEEAGPQDRVAPRRTRRAAAQEAQAPEEAEAETEAQAPEEAQAEAAAEASGAQAEVQAPAEAKDHGGGRGGEPAPGAQDGAVATDSSAGMAESGGQAPEQLAQDAPGAGEAVAGTPTLEEVRAAAQRLIDQKGFSIAHEVCKAAGVAKINASLTPAQLSAVKAEIDRRL